MPTIARASYVTPSTLAYHSYNGQIHYTFITPDFRRLCGQWLTWYRLQRGLTVTSMARQIGISASTLNLLELGRAHRQTLPEKPYGQLGAMLGNERYSAEFITQIVAGASGHLHKLDEQILRQIRADLTATLPLQ